MPIEYKIFGKTPFTVTNEMRRFAKNYTPVHMEDIVKAKRIFEWMRENIEYDHSVKLRNSEYRYKPAHEVYSTKMAICLDQAFLYTTLVREAGIESKIVFINVDERENEVCHACSSIEIDGDILLVDPAQNKFDAMHRDYKIFSDEEAIRAYFGYRHTYGKNENGHARNSEIVNWENRVRENEIETIERKKMARDLTFGIVAITYLIFYANYMLNH